MVNILSIETIFTKRVVGTHSCKATAVPVVLRCNGIAPQPVRQLLDVMPSNLDRLTWTASGEPSCSR
jgi:hypothetical protein